MMWSLDELSMIKNLNRFQRVANGSGVMCMAVVTYFYEHLNYLTRRLLLSPVCKLYIVFFVSDLIVISIQPSDSFFTKLLVQTKTTNEAEVFTS